MTATTEFRDMTRTLYRVVSSPPGQRDWDAVRRYYHPDARLVRTGLNPDGSTFARVMSIGEYVENVEELLREARFSETEVAHEAVVFGNVARLTSVYEYTFSSPAGTRRGRGVNFFTLVNDGARWQIMSIVWDNERSGVSLADSGLDD